jgi:hypothetical protein
MPVVVCDRACPFVTVVPHPLSHVDRMPCPCAVLSADGFQEHPRLIVCHGCYLHCRRSGWLAPQDHPAYIPRLLSAVTGRAAADGLRGPRPVAQEDVGGRTGMLVRRSGMVWKG